MGWPEDGKIVIKSLASNSEHYQKEIQKVEWLPTHETLSFERNGNGLIVSLPPKPSDELSHTNVIKIIS